MEQLSQQVQALQETIDRRLSEGESPSALAPDVDLLHSLAEVVQRGLSQEVQKALSGMEGRLEARIAKIPRAVAEPRGVSAVVGDQVAPAPGLAVPTFVPSVDVKKPARGVVKPTETSAESQEAETAVEKLRRLRKAQKDGGKGVS